MVLLVHKEHKEIKVLRDQLEHEVVSDRRVLKEHRALKDLSDYVVLLDLQEHKEIKVLRDQ